MSVIKNGRKRQFKTFKGAYQRHLRALAEQGKGNDPSGHPHDIDRINNIMGRQLLDGYKL